MFFLQSLPGQHSTVCDGRLLTTVRSSPLVMVKPLHNGQAEVVLLVNHAIAKRIPPRQHHGDRDLLPVEVLFNKVLIAVLGAQYFVQTVLFG